jgi:hypothetical protein
MRAWALSLLLVATTATTMAEAEESAATQLLRRGVALRREHRDAEALTAFEAANLSEPSPCAVAQVGLALSALRRWVEAEAHLKAALAQPGDPWIQRHRAALEGSLSAVASHLGWLRIDSPTPGAQLMVDGHLVLIGEAPIRVNAGTVSFAVRAAGYRGVDGQATVLPGDLAQMPVALEPDASPEEIPSSPPALQERAERVTSESHSPPERVQRPLDIKPSVASPWIVSAPLLAGGVAALGVGSAFGWLAFDARQTRDANCLGQHCDAAGLAADADARTRAAAATVSVAVGAGALAAAAVWLAVSHRPRIQLAASAGVTTGVVVRGDW